MNAGRAVIGANSGFCVVFKISEPNGALDFCWLELESRLPDGCILATSDEPERSLSSAKLSAQIVDASRWNRERPLWYFDAQDVVVGAQSARGRLSTMRAPRLVQSAPILHSLIWSGHSPEIRRELLDSNFQNCTRHLDFLLSYAQMMRARSLLFFERQYAEWKNTKALVVEAVYPETNSVKLRSMDPEIVERPTAITSSCSAPFCAPSQEAGTRSIITAFGSTNASHEDSVCWPLYGATE